MSTKPLGRLADDPSIGTPVGLAVTIAADIEHVHNAIYGNPARALARLLGIAVAPDYKALEAKLQYDRAMLTRVLADFDTAAESYDANSPRLAITRSCLRAFSHAAEYLIPLVRHHGKLERLPFAIHAQNVRGYKGALAYIDSNRETIVTEWAPCRANEELIVEYCLRIAKQPLVAQQNLDSPQLAAATESLSDAKREASAGPEAALPDSSSHDTSPGNPPPRGLRQNVQGAFDVDAYATRRIATPVSEFIQAAVGLTAEQWKHVVAASVSVPRREQLRELAARAGAAEGDALAGIRANSVRSAGEAAARHGLGVEASEAMSDAARWLTIYWLPSTLARREISALYEPFEADLPMRRFASDF